MITFIVCAVLWYLSGVVCAVAICYRDGAAITLKEAVEIMPMCLLGPILSLVVGMVWLEDSEVVVWKGREE